MLSFTYNSGRTHSAAFGNNMKRIAIPIFAILLVSQVMAFDPAGPPPKKTVEWTVSYITNVTIPRIDFDDPTTLGECIGFLNMAVGAPKAFRVEIDGSSFGETKLAAPAHLKIQARDIKLIVLLGKIADAVQAEIVIEAGQIRLIPKDAAEQSVTPNRSLAPSQKSKPSVRGSGN